jgi:CBS domain-containing protein
MIFLVTWYFFTITTYGTNVPAGLFLPGMIVGCTLGNVLVRIIIDFNVITNQDANFYAIRKKFIILGCGAFMAGYTRMTYSLGVILMETTQDLSLFVPLLFAIIIANQTGYFFTRSLYQRATRGKQLSIITDKIPPPCRDLKAGDIMSTNPVCLKAVDTVENIRRVLLSNNHHAYPLLNSNG